MKKLIVNAVAGIGLFAGSLVGMLAATGRLNHDGAAGIPGLGALFPAPPTAAEGEGKAAAQPVDGSASKSDAHGVPADASSVVGGQQPQGADERLPPKEGRSVFPDKQKEQASGAGHGGEGGGAKAEGGAAHGGGTDQGPQPASNATATSAHGEDPAANAVAKDFEHLQGDLEGARSAYSVGNYFRFEGMPAGITPAQLDEAWKRVQQTIEELDKRKMALDLRERDLLVQEKDIRRRQTDLGVERVSLENLQKALDSKISEFKQQVTIVQADELPALKRNAEMLASFGPQKGAELVQEQWKTEQGQKEVIKLMELMDKESVEKLVATLPNAMIRDVLEKRLHVSREKPKTGSGR